MYFGYCLSYIFRVKHEDNEYLLVEISRKNDIDITTVLFFQLIIVSSSSAQSWLILIVYFDLTRP